MASVGDLEVFIPEHSCVITLPVRSLPSSIMRKMAVCPEDSERPAVFICPVELREKGATPRPRPLTPGQIQLPVVTSNHKAFRTLQNFMQSGESSLQFSAEMSHFAFHTLRNKNSIILFNSNTFLIEPKPKMPDWPSQKQSPSPLECEAPPPNTPVKTQNDDITERRRRRSKDGTGAAEDHGKCTEASQESEADAMEEIEEEKQEAPTKDSSTNTPRIKPEKTGRGFGAAGSSEHGRANEMTSASANQKSSSDQIKISESSGAKAKCRKNLVYPALHSSSETNANQTPDKNEVKGKIGDSEIGDANADDREDAKEDAAKSESYVEVQSHEGQSSRCKSAVEIMDVTDDNENSDQESADVKHVSRVEYLLKTCESIQRRIYNCVTSMGPVLERKTLKSPDVVMETSAGHDDLLIVKEPNRHVSGNKRHADRTSVKPVAEGQVLISRSHSRACPSMSRECGESTVEIVDHHDEEDGQIVCSHGHQNGDVANGIKWRNKDEARISKEGGSSAKRQKCKDDANSSSERNHSYVSCSDRSDETKAVAEGIDEVQRIKAEDASAQRNLQEHEEVLMKVTSRSSEAAAHEAESEVLAVKPRPDDRVLSEGSRGLNGDEAGGFEECDVSEVLSKETSEMKKANDEEEAASFSEKRPNVCGPCCEPDDGVVLSAAEGVDPPAPSEHHEFAAQRSGASNQSALREDTSVLPRSVYPPGNHETDYGVLRREENINRMREKLRRMEEKLNALKYSKH